ncbi:hypothetical protein KC19_3G204200 [Ceratodon purpureus]|uniref:Gamma-tubulin complex component 6 n=1 Tax=Ceratodon purpureus TaxID=3225 RepID=A0A8T0IND6_CERPU|nr:hypothetical protein KC19_3G204200 [Ceratodon purpureus]
MEVDGECRNYRLRLGLPELSQPFFGSWLSPDSPAPPDSFFFDTHSHFPPSEPASASASPPGSSSPSPLPPLPPLSPHLESNGSDTAFAAEPLVIRIQEETRIRSSDDVQENEDEGEGQELEPDSGVELSNLWLHAGGFSEGQPRRLDWEVTHVREEVLGARSSAAISGKIEAGSRTRDFLSSPSNAENELENLRSMHFNFDSIQESDLVRAALLALQGVPTAVSWLEQLAADFSSTAADRSSESFTTLWTRSSSSSSLSKVLTEFAKAGRVACQLDYFTSFFLNQRTDSYRVGTSGTQNSCVGDSSRKKRKRQNFMTERSSELHLESTTELWEDVDGLHISPHCHTNQAFAAAVRTFVQGNLASLDKIRSSVKHRRQIALGGRSERFSEFMDGEAGLVFGFGSGDVTLLELFLHSHKQRELLQALAALCRIYEGDSSVSSSGNVEVDNTCIRAGDVNMKSSPFEMETHLFSASRNAFKEFPRGADLLSYLFDKLSEADTLHLELIRFLFERACQPYIAFIRSWLYLATVQDPFGEFFVKAMPSTGLKKRPGETREQDILLSYEIPKGVVVPCFLEEVCTPLLRAGQQLQVLSKLLDAPSASKIVDSPFKSSGSFQDTLLSFTCWSDTLTNKSTSEGPVLCTIKTDKQGDAQQPKRFSQMLEGFPDVSLGRLAKSTLFQQKTVRSGIMGRTSSLNDFWPSGTADNSEQKFGSAKKRQEPDVKTYQMTMARAALIREEAVDDISIAPTTRQESSQSLLQSPTFLADKSKELHVGQYLKSRLLNQFHPLNSESASSFISDFQRGTSWPVLGLPKNPFLSLRDEVDSSFSYIHTVFPENNGCWDVNVHWMDPHSVTGTRVQSLSLEQDLPTSESRFVSDDQKDDVNHPLWLKNLEDYLSKQLTAGLDEQILEAHYGGLECQFDKDNDYGSADSVGFQPWGSSTRVQGPHVLQRNGGRRLQANSHSAFVMDSFEKQYLDDNCLLRENDTDVESPLPARCSVVDDAYEKHEHPSRADFLEADDGKGPMLLQANVWDSVLLQNPEVAGPDEISRPTEENLSEDGRVISGAYYEGTGTIWESYLHSEYQQIMDVGYLQHAPSCDDDEGDDEEIPLSVAVKLWIDEEILYQYKRTSMLTIRLLQESLRLQDHFAALRRYYFMERGDWAEYFLSALCKYEWNRLGSESQLLEVQSMLGTALQNSSCDGDEFADRLYVVQSGYDSHPSGLRNSLSAFSRHQHSLGTFVDCNKIEAFDFIKVGYKVEWPLCLIITPSALSHYSAIFTFLLRMKLTMCALADVWRNLQVMGYSLNKGRRSSNYQEQNKKFRTLQLFRQQIGHVATTLQRYTESQILHAVWSKFLYSIENEVNDIQDLEKVHSVYLNDAYHQCFLSRDMEEAKNCIDAIMQCTLDFRNTLHAASLEHSRDLEPVDDVVFNKVLGVKSIFEEHLQKLYSFHQRPEPQYSVLLSDFWMCLNYNGCLKAKK